MNGLKNIFTHMNIRHQLYAIFLCCALVYTFVSSFLPQAQVLFDSFFADVIFLTLAYAAILCAWAGISCLFKNDAPLSLQYGGIVLSPFFLLVFWRWTGTILPAAFAFSGITAASFLFYFVLSGKISGAAARPRRTIIFLGLIVATAVIFLGAMSVRGYLNFSFFNSKDFAIYNQFFYNTVHGRPFENFAYGNHFAEHNSPFLFLLLPFYYLFPHPLTLLIIKIAMLGISVIPFYLICRAIAGRGAACGLSLAYLFYPFLVSQYFTPPHEITFAPFFILLTYYFYLRGRFIPFLVFLVLSLSIKEHIAFLSMAFGVLAAWERKPRRWVIFPLALGIAWSIFSFLIISHFRSLFPDHPQGAWLLENIKTRLSKNAAHPLAQIQSLLSGSNFAHWYVLRYASLLITPLGIIIPFLSNVTILCLPETVLNFLSDRPGMFLIPYHYNIMVSCFLLVATAWGIKKISSSRWVKKLGIDYDISSTLCSFFIAALVIVHAYSWLWLIGKDKNRDYIRSMHEVISILPPDAFVTSSRSAAIHISNRTRYNLFEDKTFGDYILLDESHNEYLPRIPAYYRQIFNKHGIILLKK